MTDHESLAQSLNSSSGSFELVMSAVLLGALGWFLDRLFGTSPLLVIIMSLFGFAGGVISVVYRYKATMAEATAERGRK